MYILLKNKKFKKLSKIDFFIKKYISTSNRFFYRLSQPTFSKKDFKTLDLHEKSHFFWVYTNFFFTILNQQGV
jgi:hypothetical protein